MDFLYFVGIIVIVAVMIGLIILMQKLQKRKVKYWNEKRPTDDEP